MNANRKAAALKNYRAIFEQGDDTIIEALKAGKENFTEKEISEIIEALGENQGDGAADIEGPATLNKQYEEWKVKPLYEADKEGRKLVGYEKDAQRPLKTTSITPERAELLNLQSENTLTRLYEA